MAAPGLFAYCNPLSSPTPLPVFAPSLRDASLHLSRTVGDAAARRVVGEVAAERASADGLERLLRKNEEKRDALR